MTILCILDFNDPPLSANNANTEVLTGAPLEQTKHCLQILDKGGGGCQ
jgi:hypothetical protein